MVAGAGGRRGVVAKRLAAAEQGRAGQRKGVARASCQSHTAEGVHLQLMYGLSQK